ncbi:MAG: SDR family NAD(P)-dependent oxidoreductase [Ruminococcaceae bacterium]|nr:SDR family NAD(P)-dependent oxidoreductase [Oscillospiraceae bacterium]MBQ8899275.1 SDR family NAD(P)-dependent oxidoreductase [Clostridia bacterium]
MKIAIITGASSGMGREFVLELDKSESFDELWVIARRKERLEALSGLTRARVRPICLDLTDMNSITELEALLKAEKPNVAVLVNAAGFGYFKAFTELPLADQLKMIDLNDKALIAVTYATLPFMEKGSRIYNLGSLSSFQPVPYINVYGASKAFVLSYSRALNVELRPRGIRVMAVCPGWVKTEFFDTAVSDDTITYYNRYYEANEVVLRALKDMRRGRDVSVCGFPIRAQVLGVKLLPHKLVMRIWCGQQKKPK